MTIDPELRQLIEAGFAKVSQDVAGVKAEQRRQGEAIAEMKGELRGLSARLASMDKRFAAIMQPCQPQEMQAWNRFASYPAPAPSPMYRTMRS